MKARERAKQSYIQELEHRLADEQQARKQADRRAQGAEAELSELQEQVAQSPYVARAEQSGEVLYAGDSQPQAIGAARRHYYATREHVTIDGSHWNTRQHGGVRRHM